MRGFRKHHDNYDEFRRQLRVMRWDLDFSRRLGLEAEVIPQDDPLGPLKREAQRALRAFRLHTTGLFLGFLPTIGECNRKGLWPALQALVQPFGRKVAQLFWELNPEELRPSYHWPTDAEIRKVFDLAGFVDKR